MSYLVTFRLRNGTEISCITQQTSLERARLVAIQESNNYLPNELHIGKETEVIHSSRWTVPNCNKLCTGMNQFSVCVIANPQYVKKFTVNGAALKTAYKNACITADIDNPYCVFIIPLKQKADLRVKKSAYKRANRVYQDRNELIKVIKQCVKITKDIPILNTFTYDIYTACELIMDYKDKRYTEPPSKTIAWLVSMVVYLVSPVDLIPDFIPVAGQLDDILVVKMTLSACHSDLETYRQWRASINRPVVVR